MKNFIKHVKELLPIVSTLFLACVLGAYIADHTVSQFFSLTFTVITSFLLGYCYSKGETK